MFCEFTNQWDTYQERVNLQYSLFIVRGEFTADGLLRIAIQDNLTPDIERFFIHDISRHTWMALIGSTIGGCDTSREHFWFQTGDTTIHWLLKGVYLPTPTLVETMPVAALRPISSAIGASNTINSVK